MANEGLLGTVAVWIPAVLIMASGIAKLAGVEARRGAPSTATIDKL